MGFFVSLRLLMKQGLIEPHVPLIDEMVNSFPQDGEANFFEESCSHDLFGFIDWEVHIFKEHVIFAEVAEDIGISGWIMKELPILDHRKVVVVFVDCVQRHFICRCYLTARSITHVNNKIIANTPVMNQQHRKDFSLPRKHHPRQSLDESRKSRHLNSPISSRVSSNEYVLRFDINTLLSLFNEMEVTGTGQLPQRAVKKILQTIGLYNHDQYLKADAYTFDHFLSILGQIQVPNEPSVYVLSFVKILTNYRDKCLLNEEEGLEEAKAVQQKIKSISQSEVQRQKNRIKQEHSKIYDQMQRSQYKQLLSFEDEWSNYLKDFREETNKKLQETRYMKKSKLMQEENKYLNKMRKTNVVTSPWLRQLMEKKKWLIHQKKYDDAIQISNEINLERLKLSQHKEETNEVILNKKLQILSSQTNRYLGAVEKNLQLNFTRLISKKKEGESIMKIRMKKLREEANRKLNDHFRSEINRLKSSFYLAANH